MPDSTTLRGATSPLDTAQTVNVVPEQVIKDQLPRNLDDALINISGITQTNTLAGTQDAVMRRGFGDNRDGSIMRNGLPLVQGRALNAEVESVEVLKGPASLLYGIIDPGGYWADSNGRRNTLKLEVAMNIARRRSDAVRTSAITIARTAACRGTR